MVKGDAQIIARIIAVKHGVPLKDAETFVTALFEIIGEGLNTDKQVKVKGLGTFKVIDVKDRESVDVNTGERIVIEGRSKITFAPDSVMKELVNKPFAQFETVVLNDGVDFSDIKETSEYAGGTAEDEMEDNAAITDNNDISDVTDNMDVQKEENAGSSVEVEVSGKDAENDVAEAAVVKEENNDCIVVGNTGGLNTGNEQHDDKKTVSKADEPADNEPDKNFDDIMHEVAIEESLDNIMTTVNCESGNGGEDLHSEDDDVADDYDDENDDNDDEDSGEAYDDDDNRTRRSVGWLWTLLLVIVVGAGMFCTGYYFGMKSAVAGVDATTDTVSAKPVAVKPAVVKDTATTVSVKQDIKKDSVKTDSVVKSSKAMQQAQRIYKTGAYIITGTKETVAVKPGQTLKTISDRKLGPDMECYIQIHNNIEDVKEGMTLKIPELKLKKKAVSKEE